MNDLETLTLADRAVPARRAASRGGEQGGSIWAVLLVVGFFLVFRVALFQPFTIPSASMEPTLRPGDYIVVSKYAYGLSRYSFPFGPHLLDGRILDQPARRGDVVVFKLPRDGRTDYIKRIIGLPGDRIQLRSGVVFLNGQPLTRQMLSAGMQTDYGVSHPVEELAETQPDGTSYLTQDFGPDGDADDTGVYVVPPHHYFVMGDNRDNSQDSRYPSAIGVGYVPEENLVGKAEMILFSLKGGGFRPDRFLKPLH
jgi:signal peptidase I